MSVEATQDCLPASNAGSDACKNGTVAASGRPYRSEKRLDPTTWHLSRWSRLGWGCHRHDLMPCMPETCPYRELRRCDDAAPGAGKPCPYEISEAQSLIDGYNVEFRLARGVLGDTIYLDLLREMVTLKLRLDRIILRDDWLGRHREKAIQDPDWFVDEVNRVHRYHVMVLNKWLSIREQLHEASADPLIGWLDIYRVQYVTTGFGPACNLRTREVSLDGVGAFDYSASGTNPLSTKWPYTDDADWRHRW